MFESLGKKLSGKREINSDLEDLRAKSDEIVVSNSKLLGKVDEVVDRKLKFLKTERYLDLAHENDQVFYARALGQMSQIEEGLEKAKEEIGKMESGEITEEKIEKAIETLDGIIVVAGEIKGELEERKEEMKNGLNPTKIN